MKKYVQVFVCFLVGVLPSFGQAPYQNTLVNQGLFVISPEAIVSTTYDFNNRDTGVVKNDGTTYYYRDFNNDNLYYHSDQSVAQAIFTPFEDNQGHQQISGAKPSAFYHVVLNNPTENQGFDLKNEMNIRGSMDFQDGIIKVDERQGMLTFHQEAKALNPSDRSHAEGYVEKVGKESFTYPIGDKGVYRYARISASAAEKDVYQSKYTLDDDAFFISHNKMQKNIAFLNAKEYWKIDKSTANKGDVMLTLSWDERTTDPMLFANPNHMIQIVRWNEKEQQWVAQGGVVDWEKKEVTAPATVEVDGYFTLAALEDKSWDTEELIIYNLVTPNNDGKNDYFIIENIQSVSNNLVEIYNRWGVKVYETMQYDTSGNVFRGYSEGRLTINKKEPLPSGTYYYIITYEVNKGKNKEMKKISGYLHLETE